MLPKKSYIIASTPRSGSNLLNSYLRNLQIFGPTTEWLNFPHMANLSGKELGFDEEFYRANPEQVLRKIVENRLGPEETFSAKIHYSHYDDMIEMGFDPFTIIKNPVFVYIKRKDIVAQAISYTKAKQQKAWTCLEKPNDDVQYDFAEIVKNLQFLITSYQGWGEFFRDHNVKPFVVLYENLEKEPRRVVKDVVEFYGKKLSIEQEKSIHTDLQRQTDKINIEWRQRFKEDWKRFQSAQD